MNEKEKVMYKLPLKESYSEAFKRRVVMEVDVDQGIPGSDDDVRLPFCRGCIGHLLWKQVSFSQPRPYPDFLTDC